MANYIMHSKGPWKKHKYIRKEGTGATAKYIYNNQQKNGEQFKNPSNYDWDRKVPAMNEEEAERARAALAAYLASGEHKALMAALQAIYARGGAGTSDSDYVRRQDEQAGASVQDRAVAGNRDYHEHRKAVVNSRNKKNAQQTRAAMEEERIYTERNKSKQQSREDRMASSKSSSKTAAEKNAEYTRNSGMNQENHKVQRTSRGEPVYNRNEELQKRRKVRGH